MMKKLLAPVLVVGLSMGMSGCADFSAIMANIASSISGTGASQATTLAEAIQAADLVTKAADVAVNTGKLDSGTLTEINSLSDGVHKGLTDLEAANAAGKPLSFAAFNAALDAFNSYMTTKGLSH